MRPKISVLFIGEDENALDLEADKKQQAIHKYFDKQFAATPKTEQQRDQCGTGCSLDDTEHGVTDGGTGGTALAAEYQLLVATEVKRSGAHLCGGGGSGDIPAAAKSTQQPDQQLKYSKIHHGAAERRSEKATKYSINAQRIPQRVEMSGVIGAGIVDGADRYFQYGESISCFDKHIGFKFKPLTGNAHQLAHEICRDAAQTCLGIRNAHAAQQPEYQTGKTVASAAFKGDLLIGKIAYTKDKVLRMIVQSLHAGQNAFRTVLTVGVCGDTTGGVGPLL